MSKGWLDVIINYIIGLIVILIHFAIYETINRPVT